MNKTINIIKIYCLTVLFLQATTAYSKEAQWEQIRDDGTVRVWKKDVPGESIMAFKGTQIFNQPISKVLWVLTNKDAEQKKRWIDMIDKFENVARDEKTNTSVSYTSFSMPWPVSDRDTITSSVKRVDSLNKSVTLDIKSISHPKP